MDPSVVSWVAALGGLGLVAGLVLLARGFAGYRTAGRIAGIGTSPIAAMAVGEVRVTGTVEPAEVLLESALQSVPCVYYRSTIRERDGDDGRREVLDEERAVGFRVRDATGAVRIFPRDAAWDVPTRFADRSSTLYGEPAGLRLRTGPAYRSALPDRDARIAALLSPSPAAVGAGGGALAILGAGTARGERHYAEARIEPGDTVTIVGRALPFGQLVDAAHADEAWGGGVAADDPEVAASIAAARASGTLLDDPREAWGNAAIPGFGIGRPVTTPVLDPAATPPDLASAEESARAERTFDIRPEELVLAVAPDAPLLVAAGAPGTAAERHNDRFLAGLAGAVLSIVSAVVLAFALTSGSPA